MKRIYIKNLLLIIFIVLGVNTAFAQQVPNPGFEDWSGAKFDGNIQPASWNASNVSQVGFNFNFAHREAGHTGSYSMMVQDKEVGAMGITETAPGYFSLGNPWAYLEGLSTGSATAGTTGGINFTYRPDSLSVWIKRTGSNTDKEDFYLLYYSWSGTAKGNKYKNKNGGCTSYSATNEESDIRLTLDANECGTSQKANQIAEGMWRERKTYGEWTNIRVPIYYFNNDVPEMMNIIFSASNYPNFRANDGLYKGNSLYVDDVELIYSSKIQKLYIGGKEWKGFDPNSSAEQIYSMSRDASSIPSIQAFRGEGSLRNARGTVANFPGRELSGKEISITPGTLDTKATVITVKAEDGSSTTTYKIKFVREASTSTRLDNIYVNGEAISNFQPSIYNYTVELPYGTTEIPEVTADLEEEEQTLQITQATSLTDKATLVVTAADKKSKATYYVQFKVGLLADNTLKDIKVNGTSIAGFTPSQTIYRVSLPTSTNSIPTVEAVSAYPAGEQTITHTAPTSATELDGSQHIISVTTPGNPTPRTYKLTYKLEASSYSLLKNLQIGDNLITNFDPNQFTYYVNLPVGTTEMPKITYEKGESTQTVTVSEGGLNGISRIVVVAGNGVDQSEYKIVVSTALSEISSLNMIYVGGEALPGFEPTKTSYTYSLPIGTTELPSITYDKGDEYQKVVVTTGGINGITRIAVTAENGSSTIYQIAFSVNKATNANLKMIYLDGQPLEGFDPNVLEYYCPLPQGTTTLPVITYDQADEYQTVTVRSGGVNGDYRITVRPQSGASQTYILHFSVATSDNAKLKMIYLDGKELNGFHPDSLHYVDTLPMGVSEIPNVTYEKGEESQKVLNVRSQNVQTIKVTAESGKTLTYTITFIIQRSNSAFLNMIYLDGQPLEGFDKNIFEYTVSLTGPTCPKITVDKEDNQQITITTPYATGQAKIVVTPEGGAPNTYIINFVNIAHNTALLKNIYVDGTPVKGFAPNVFEYEITSTSLHPEITYDVDSSQKVSIFRQDNVVTLYVVSGEYNTQYKLTISTQPKSDCTLRKITIDGNTIAGFDATKMEYTLTINSKDTPSISYEKQYEEQTVYAGLLNSNTYSMLVRAQSGDTARYLVHMQRMLSDDANLVNLTVAGMNIDFQPTTYEYNLSLPQGVALPDIQIEAKEEQSTTMHIVSDVEQQVVVTAESGKQQTYRILYSRTISSDAYLSDILVNGQSLNGFKKMTFHYTDTLAWRSKVVPCVQPIGTNEGQTITTYHGAVDGITKIEVISPDGATTQEYTIHFPVIKSSNVGLEYLILDHESLVIEYHEDTTDYTIAVPYQETAAPLVLYKALEPEQTVEYISRPLGQTSQLIVTAEDGNQRTYNLHFKPTYATQENLLTSLIIEETGDSLDINTTSHSIALPYGTRTMTVQYTKAYAEQTVWVQPGGIKSPTTITIKANRPGEKDVVYTLTPKVETQDPAVLTDIKVNGNKIEGFDLNRFSYVINVTSKPSIKCTAYSGATVKEEIDDKHWRASVTAEGRTNTYDIWFYYSEENIPNNDFTEWTKTSASNTDKPVGWSVPGDKLDTHLGTAKAGTTVSKNGTSVVHLQTTNWAALAGPVPAVMNLGDINGSFAVAGGTNITPSGFIKFRNTPDQVNIRYNYSKSAGDGALFRFKFFDEEGEEHIFDHSRSNATGSYTNVSLPLNTSEIQVNGLDIIVDATGKYPTASSNASLYVDYIRFAYNNTLTGILVNGDTATLSSKTFSITLPNSEDTQQPTLSFIGEVPDQAQKVVWGKEVNNSGYGVRTAVIYNYAEDGTYSTYTLTVKRPLDKRNTLSDLLVSGKTIENFDPTTYEYVYTLSSNQNLPDLQPIADGSLQTITTHYADSIMSISVKPEYGSSTVYRVRFETKLSDDVELSNITLEGENITFDPAQKEYAVTANKLPTITYVKKMDGQTVVQDNGVLTVTAENGNKGVYTIHLNKPTIITTGELSMIEVDGLELQEFNSTIYNYTLEKPKTILFKRMADSDSVIYVQTPDSMELQVYGTEQHTYRITYPSTPSSNTEMDSILINGEMIEGFNTQIREYTYLTDEPVHIKTIANAKAKAMEMQQTIIGDTTTYAYTITAEDGSKGVPYIVTVAPNLSNSAYLEGIYVDGKMIQGYRKDSLTYTITLPTSDYKVIEPQLPSISYALGAPRQQVTVEHGNLGDITTLFVQSEDGTTQATYELLIEAEPSHCVDLTGIAINGQPIDNFTSSRHHYFITCNDDEIELTWSSDDHFQDVTISNLGTEYIIKVTAQDGINTAEYIIYVYQETASADVTLAGILLDGQTFDSFEPTINKDLIFSPMQQRYNINLPSGTQYLPGVTALLNSEGQQVEISINNWDVIITVTAPDGVSTNTYILHFSAPKSNNTLLKMIYLDGDTLNNFVPTTYRYDILLPVGQTNMPNVYAEPQEATQTVLDSITGDMQHTIFVTAEDGSQNQYYLSFILNPSNIDTLSAIYSDGVLIQGFRPDSFYYAYTLPVGTTYFPTLTWDAGDVWQTITSAKALDTPTKQITQIQVVAGSGKKNIYTIEYEIALSTIDTLEMIYMGADPLTNFDAHVYDYHIYMSPGDTILPSISWKQGDIYQVVTPTSSAITRNNEQIGWKQCIEVMAQDGHSRVYTLYFYFTEPLSTNTELLNIYLDGAPLNGFNPGQYTYRETIEEGKLMPNILIEKADANQTVNIDTTTGNAIITVVAEDTTYQSTYTIYFTYLKSSYAYLEGIYQDGVLIEGFRPDSFDYHIILPYGTETLPEFTYQIGKEGQSVNIETIVSAINTTHIFTVIAPDEETASAYNIVVEVSPNHNSSLKSLLIKGVEIENFHKDSTYYLISYPIGTDASELANQEDITAIAEDENASVVISQNGQGFTILVTAEDDIHTTLYTIEQIIQLGSNTRLSALYIDSVLLRDFDPDINEYIYYVTDGQPSVNAIAEDSTSTVGYGIYAVDAPFDIYVTAEDGSERVYTIHFVQSTINTSATPNALDVLMKHIHGTRDIAFATLRKNVSVGVYNTDGQTLFYAPVPESNQNDVIMITNAEAQEELIDVYTPLLTFSLPKENQCYFYIFFENGKRKIASGKLFFAP